MAKPTRRSVLRASLGFIGAGAVGAPYVARAQAKTATVWWVQGFAHEEVRQKIVAAMATGQVPDLFQNNPPEITALYAWDDKLVDVSDVVDTQRQHYADTALSLVNCYNNVAKKRGIYGVPYTIDVFTNHIWQSLVEKSGFKIEDIPKTWYAFYDFFKVRAEESAGAGITECLRHGFPADHQRR